MAPRRRPLGEVAQAVAKYESFIEDQLKPDLYSVLSQRNEIYDKISDYLKLRNDVTLLQQAELTSVKTLVDLGCNVYCQAVVPDASRILVDIGFGFFAELTLSQALDFAEKKTTHLEKQAEQLTEKANTIRANIKLVLDALQELQFTMDTRE